MNIRSLPRYRGPRDRRRLRTEPDGHGKKSGMRFRDYVILLVLILAVGLLWVSGNDRFRQQQRRVRLEKELRMFGPTVDIERIRNAPW